MITTQIVNGKRVLAFLGAACLSLAALVAASPNAQALGTAYQNCAQSLTVTGKSSSSGGSTSAPTNSNPDLGCGVAKVRVAYQTYPGSPTYYTSWKSASGIVSYNPGNTVVGAQHDCGYKAPAYSGSFPFLT